MVERLAEIEAKQDLTNDMVRSNNEMLVNLMNMMQLVSFSSFHAVANAYHSRCLQAMGENKQIAERIQQGLSSNLYQLQRKTGHLLPNFNLNSGEVKRTGSFPVRGNATMDIYEGIYLGSEKVSMKAIRAMKTDERTVHVRASSLRWVAVVQFNPRGLNGKGRSGRKSGNATVESSLCLSTGSVRSMVHSLT